MTTTEPPVPLHDTVLMLLSSLAVTGIYYGLSVLIRAHAVMTGLLGLVCTILTIWCMVVAGVGVLTFLSFFWIVCRDSVTDFRRTRPRARSEDTEGAEIQ